VNEAGNRADEVGTIAEIRAAAKMRRLVNLRTLRALS